MIPAAAKQASILPSRSPIIFPIFHICSYKMRQRSATTAQCINHRGTHLVRNVSAHILQMTFVLSSHTRHEFLHSRPIRARRMCNVDAVYRASPYFSERQSTLEAESAVRSGDHRYPVCERELFLEKRRRSWGRVTVSAIYIIENIMSRTRLGTFLQGSDDYMGNRLVRV